MAENNEAVIDTKLRGVEDVKKDISQVESALIKLSDRMKKYRELEGNRDNRTYRGMQYDYEMLQEKLEKLNKEMEDFGKKKTFTERLKDMIKGCKNASKQVDNLGNSVSKSNKGFSLGLKKLLLYAVGIRSLQMAIQKLRQMFVEGFKNLAQFNDGMNPTNVALSNLKTSLTLLKNSLATAFAPILQVVAPALTFLIDKLAEVANAFGMFMAILTGQATFTKAVKVQEDYAKSLQGTSASAKEAKKSLSGLDKLNVISSNSTSGGGTSNKANEMFEVVKVDEMDNGLTRIARKIKEVTGVIVGSLKKWAGGLDTSKIQKSFAGLIEAAEPLLDKLGNGLLWLLENVLEPIGTFVIEDALPASIDVFSSALDLLNSILEALQPLGEWLWNNLLQPIAGWTAEATVNLLNKFNAGLKDMSDWVKKHQKSVQNITLVILAFAAAFGIVSAAVATYNGIVTVATAVTGGLKVALAFLTSPIGLVTLAIGSLIAIGALLIANWEELPDKVKDIFMKIWEGIKAVINFIIGGVESMINGIVKAFNVLIGALNKISFKFPDWMPGDLAGKQFGLNLQTIKEANLPRLASGTVVPRQFGEFRAILGDNQKEPEVVSPLSTMKQALQEVLNERGNGGGDIVVEIDGYEVFRAVRQQAKEYENRSHTPAFS